MVEWDHHLTPFKTDFETTQTPSVNAKFPPALKLGLILKQFTAIT